MEITRVFGLLAFGAEAENWDEEVFFYRTGIALRMYKERMMPSRL